MKPKRYIHFVVLVAMFLFFMICQTVVAGPPEKPGNPGVPGLLAEISELNDIIEELEENYQNFAPVPQTGQTESYHEGDDGDLRMGVEWPDPRFTDNGDGTVTDNLTGLIWLQNANRFGPRTWSQALTDCNDLEDDGYYLTDGSEPGDWRLPNLKELLSLIDYSTYNPTLPEGHPFSGVQSDIYWSSTTGAWYNGMAWIVSLNLGYANYRNKSSTLCVWPVRGGQ